MKERRRVDNGLGSALEIVAKETLDRLDIALLPILERLVEYCSAGRLVGFAVLARAED